MTTDNSINKDNLDFSYHSIFSMGPDFNQETRALEISVFLKYIIEMFKYIVLTSLKTTNALNYFFM